MADSVQSPSASWPRLPTSRDLDARICDHLPLVGQLTNEILTTAPGSPHRDELVSAGMLALVLAARGFGESHEPRFAEFVAPRIRNALADVVSSPEGLARDRHSAANRAQVVADLRAVLQRVPTPAEVAMVTGLHPPDVGTAEMADSCGQPPT